MKKSIIEFINLLSNKTLKREKGEVYIFSIAIDNYCHESKLNHCIRDSEYLINIISDKSFNKIKQKNIYKLYNQEATKKNIYHQFKLLSKVLTGRDRLILHMAGHSNVEFNTNFFIPYDGEKKYVYSNISNQIINGFISSANHNCIFISNTFNATKDGWWHDKQHWFQEEYKSEQLANIYQSKFSIYSELINFLQNSERHIHKSIWHFTKSKSNSSINKPIIIYEDKRELTNFLENTRANINQLIEKGNYFNVLQKILIISNNNDQRLRDQADALLYYLKEGDESNKLLKPIEENEIKGITKSLVHQVHESGYYLVPSTNLLKAPKDKSQAKIILYTSADVADKSRLRLDEEYRAINLELLRSPNRDEFELVPCLSSRITDLQRELLEKEPYIVHFTGHGTCKGICMIGDDTGNTQIIKNKPLGGLFKLFSKSINCVFLNSCHSSSQSSAIGEHIENVVCMSSAIKDVTAIKFSSAFYMSLGTGKDVPFSFEFAKNSIDLHDCTDKDLPILINKNK